MPCRNFQITTAFIMIAFYGYLQFRLGDGPQFTKPSPIIDHMGVFPTFPSSLCRNPTPNSFRTSGTSCQTAFPKGCSNFHPHQQRVRMPAPPPSPETDGSGPWTASPPGGQERAGNGFASDAGMTTPGPEPQE